MILFMLIPPLKPSFSPAFTPCSFFVFFFLQMLPVSSILLSFRILLVLLPLLSESIYCWGSTCSISHLLTTFPFPFCVMSIQIPQI